MMTFLKLILAVVALVAPVVCQDDLLVWGYECRQNKCVKVPLSGESRGQGQTVCRMLCGDEIGTLWPKPRDTVKKGSFSVQINRNNIKFQTPSNLNMEKLWTLVKIRFKVQIENKIPERSLLPNIGRQLMIRISVDTAPTKLSYETDESYFLRIRHCEKQVLVEINGKTFFGARHGLETLSQLIVYDEVGESIQIITDTEISDSPAFKHRGVLLDTARNYFSVKSIKRTIDGMAMSKLNVFQWHITDSSSFPMVVRSRPDFHNLGAYSARKIYTRGDITNVVEYALSRGVRVIPEFDAPAHVGEGWQNTNMITCFNAQPWRHFCQQAPCGQLDPTNDALYDVLEDIYRAIFESFDPNLIHMGSDTVSFNCWNASEPIRNWILAKDWGLEENAFIKLWGYFQNQALARVDKVSKNKNVSVIVWANRLADESHIDEFLDKSRYIVQTYESKPDFRTKLVLSRGIRMIATTSDLFIDGDTASWIGGWNDTAGWQKFYQHKPEDVVGGQKEFMLGSQAAVFSEQVDEFSLDTLLWPKASALAERLWTNPDHGWQEANSRFVMHRTHLTENGLKAAALQPEWCFLNNNECPKYAYD